MFGVPTNRSKQYEAFQIVSNLHQLVGTHRVTNALNRLLDYWALVEMFGDIVRGRADNFHPTRIGLMIGPCTLESGKERMVDIDAAACEPLANTCGKYLHVPSENQEITVRSVKYLK